MIDENKTSVLITGAGPSGLILALWLKKKNIDFRIIDKTSEPGTTSRALAVQARTLEFYRQLGIADELIDNGIIVREIKMRRKGRIIATAHFGALGEGMSPYPYLLFCSQDIHEKILCDLLEKMGVHIERNTELIDFSQNDDGVSATVQKGGTKEIIKADYLVGADGAHSAVRHRLHTDFEGGTYSQVFFVADVTVADMAGYEGLQVSISMEDFCIIMPIKQRNTIRLTGIVPPQSEKKEHITYDDVAESVKRNTGLNVTGVNWFSVYHVHHRVAENFTKDRVFLVGDAAHIHSPAGGQGMNTGIGDAINLAWKLAEVIQQRANPGLLQSFEPERMAFAKVLVKSTDTAFWFIAARSWLGSFFRTYLLPTFFAQATKVKPFLKLMFITISQIRIKYRESFLSSGTVGELHAGDRLPFVQNKTGDNFDALKSLNWQVHVYGKVQNDLRASAKELAIEVHEFEWNAEAAEKGLTENAVYLIRPDGYVAFTSVSQDTKGLKEYWQKL